MAQDRAGKNEALKIVYQPEDYFRELLVQSFENQNLTVIPETEVYLVKLLSQFMSTEYLYAKDQDGNLRDEPLALKLKEALETPTAEAQKLMFRHLGDVSLYTAGFFQDSLNRKRVDLDYYIDMGGLAYRNVATLVVESTPKVLFEELSAKFGNLVEVFAEVSHQTIKKDEVNLLRIYENFLRTGSERAKKTLEENGINPVEITAAKKPWN